MKFNISTEVLAQYLNLRPQSIRARLCRTGSYFGVRPQRLPNGRLLWPENAVDLLLKKTDNVTASDEAA
jgi:hypothetical protein